MSVNSVISEVKSAIFSCEMCVEVLKYINQQTLNCAWVQYNTKYTSFTTELLWKDLADFAK